MGSNGEPRLPKGDCLFQKIHNLGKTSSGIGGSSARHGVMRLVGSDWIGAERLSDWIRALVGRVNAERFLPSELDCWVELEEVGAGLVLIGIEDWNSRVLSLLGRDQNSRVLSPFARDWNFRVLSPFGICSKCRKSSIPLGAESKRS